MALDLAGIAVSAGSACSSGKVKPSHVVTAMGFAPSKAATALRVSLGAANTESDIDAFMAAWKRIQAPAATQIQPAA
jgi:cysteine desulfurase